MKITANADSISVSLNRTEARILVRCLQKQTERGRSIQAALCKALCDALYSVPEERNGRS